MCWSFLVIVVDWRINSKEDGAYAQHQMLRPPLESGQQANVRQTKGWPALACVHRRHLATGNINGIDW